MCLHITAISISFTFAATNIHTGKISIAICACWQRDLFDLLGPANIYFLFESAGWVGTSSYQRDGTHRRAHILHVTHHPLIRNENREIILFIMKITGITKEFWKIRKSNHRCARLSELSVLLLYLYYCLALYLHYCITGISSLQMLFPTIYRWYNFTPNISRRIPMRYTYLTKNLDEL